MSTEVIFYITIKNTNIHAIANKLKSLDLTVFPFSIEDVGKGSFDPNHLMCSAVFSETEGILGLVSARRDALRKLDGINGVEIMHDKWQRERRPWYDHFMIPILISICVEALTIFSIMEGLDVNLEMKTFLLVIGIPAVTTFFSAVGYTHYRRIY